MLFTVNVYIVTYILFIYYFTEYKNSKMVFFKLLCLLISGQQDLNANRKGVDLEEVLNVENGYMWMY